MSQALEDIDALYDYDFDWRCSRCGARICESVFNVEEERTDPNGVVWSPSGEAVTPTGASYCPTCAPDVAYCHVCGCTEEAGCEDGCWWVADDLCSSCQGEEVLA